MKNENKIEKLELETVELKNQIMKLEFQHKKDIVDAEKRFNDKTEKIQNQIDYIAKLAGITYQELDLLDEKIIQGGQVLTSSRKRV
jgi:acetate kinase